MHRFLSILFFVGVFLFSATPVFGLTDAGQIQAAATSTQIFKTDTTFEGNVNWFKKGIWIGQQGSGGVTYFNGSIVNGTTDKNGNDNPVTFADNVRIDGSVYRGSKAGWKNDTQPFLVNDNVQIYGGLTVDQESTFADTVTLSGATLQGMLTAGGGINATRGIAASGGHVVTISQSAADAATSTRSALYLVNSGISTNNDYLIYSTPFKVSKDGNTTIAGTLSVTGNTTVGGTLAATGNATLGGTLTTTGLITANGGVILGDGTTLTVGSGETFNATGATVSGLDSRGTLSFPLGSIAVSSATTVVNGWTPGTTLTPVRVSAYGVSNATGANTTLTLSDDGGTTSDTLTIAQNSSTGYLTTLTNFNSIDTTNGALIRVNTNGGSISELTVIIEYTVPVQ